MKVSIIGACGHVGFPFSLVVAEAGHTVYGIDVNTDMVKSMNNKIVPYVEDGAQEILDKVIGKNLAFTNNFSLIQLSDVVVIMIGTPIDEEGNPRMDDLFGFVDNTLCKYLKKNTLIVLRSTVAPGTTELIRDRIQSKLGWKEGLDFYLVFCPERVLQTKGISETKNLPALIGAFNFMSRDKASDFFDTFIDNSITLTYLSPRETEIAKLITNMWRRINGAFANELYMIGDNYDVDIFPVIAAANFKYDRMNVMYPGFMAGPCLTKDGQFLVDKIPYNELIKNSFEINEGFVGYIFDKAFKLLPSAVSVGLLGTGFKGNCDDERHSLTFKMKKLAIRHGLEVKMHDPYHNYNTMDEVLGCDIVIVMSPHKEYIHIDRLSLKSKLFVDIWKRTEVGSLTKDGFYKSKEDLT